MRFAVRTLIVLTFPVLVFGWLSSAQLLPAAPDPVATTATFLLGGVLFVVAGSVGITVVDLGRAWRSSSTVRVRPVATAVVVVASYVGAGMIGLSGLSLAPSEKLGAWLAVVTVIAVVSVALLVVTVMVRSLAGLWSRPDLAMWPGRRFAIVLLLLVAVAATPVRGPDHGVEGGFGEARTAVPLGERVWLDLSGDRTPSWIYADDSAGQWF